MTKCGCLIEGPHSHGDMTQYRVTSGAQAPQPEKRYCEISGVELPGDEISDGRMMEIALRAQLQTPTQDVAHWRHEAAMWKQRGAGLADELDQLRGLLRSAYGYVLHHRNEWLTMDLAKRIAEELGLTIQARAEKESPRD